MRYSVLLLFTAYVSFISCNKEKSYEGCATNQTGNTNKPLTAIAGPDRTESLAMNPPASVCGWYIAHPQSHYFGLGKIGRDQLQDYAKRKGMSLEEAEKWLRPVLE